MPLNYFANLPTPSRPRVDPMQVASAFASRPIPTPPEYGTILESLGRDRGLQQQAAMTQYTTRANAAVRGRELEYDWQKFYAQLEAAKEQAERTGDVATLNNLITLGTLVGTRGAGMVPWDKIWKAMGGSQGGDPGSAFPMGVSPGRDLGGTQGFYDYPVTPANLPDYDPGFGYDPTFDPNYGLF
ncbi:MAG: hypothetical protein ACREMG_05075 [Gemmatimonadales bacterium]